MYKDVYQTFIEKEAKTQLTDMNHLETTNEDPILIFHISYSCRSNNYGQKSDAWSWSL